MLAQAEALELALAQVLAQVQAQAQMLALVQSLEEMLQAAVCEGQERTRRPWRRILVAVEGIYSMEGEFCDLAGIIRVAKAHKCYVYLDEAHSIGATGRTGRGVCEWAGVDCRGLGVDPGGQGLTCLTNAWDYRGSAADREGG